MRWVFLILIGVMCYGGFVQHTYNEQSIKEGTKELLEDNGYGRVGVEGINLPLSYTFLAQKTVSEVFITNGGKHSSIDVIVTPIESFPIVSIFNPPSYQISINPLNSLSLGTFLEKSLN